MNVLGNAFTKIGNILGVGNRTFNNIDTDMNNLTMNVNVAELTSYLMNAYEIDNLPKDIDKAMLWAMLVRYGNVVMFNDSSSVTDPKYRVLPYSRKDANKSVNTMMKPTRVNAHDVGKQIPVVVDGIRTEPELKRGVRVGELLFVSNTSRYLVDFNSIIYFYAHKMTDIDRTMDTRRMYHKIPVIYSGVDEQKSTFEKMFNDAYNNKTFFVNTREFMNEFQIQSADISFLNDKLQGERSTLVNQFLLSIGVTVNKQEDKTERMITSEVEAIDEQVYINRRNILDSLNQFCDGFNEKFGTEMYARYVGDDFNETVFDIEEDVFDEIDL